MKGTKRIAALLTALLMALGLAGCSARPADSSLQIFAMDTVMDLYAVGADTAEVLSTAAQEIKRLEALLSRTRESSEISRLNTDGAAALSEETRQLLRQALDYSALTGGAFDVTIAPLVEAWNIQGEEPRVPGADELAALLELVGAQHLRLTEQGAELDAGCAVDLGGIAKGYASDVVAQLYRDSGVSGGWISLGGNVYAHGRKADGSAWSVAVRDPQDTAASAALLELSDEFAVTSGGYQRYFTAPDGTVYQHIIDPSTGAPAQSDLLSVTIVGSSGTMADAYSTALYVMGEAGAVDFWRAQGDFDMVLITADGRLCYTTGLAGRITTEEGGAYVVQTIS